MAEYEEGKFNLPGVIALAGPRAIFAFGYAHRDYSEGVINDSHIPYVFSVHPIQDSQQRFELACRRFVEMVENLRD